MGVRAVVLVLAALAAAAYPVPVAAFDCGGAGGPMPNDDRHCATEWTLRYGQDYNTNTAATVESGESTPCGQIPQTLWYRFTAWANGTAWLGFYPAGVGEPASVGAIYEDGAFLGCGASSPRSGYQNGVTFECVAGRTYEIQASKVSGTGGNVQPVHDLCPIKPGDVPGVPLAFAATPGPGRGEVSFAWSAPWSDGGSPVTEYVLELPLVNDVTLGPEVRSYVASGLAESYEQQFHLRAANANGVGASAFAKATPPGVPYPPTNLRATQQPALVRLSWTPPGLTGGSPLTGYVVEAATNGGSFFVVGEPTGTAFEERDVGDDQTRAYRVSAKNRYGPGDPSGILTVTIPRKPSEPQGVVADWAVLPPHAVEVRWSPPAVAPGAITYQVFWATSPDGPFEHVATTTQTVFVHEMASRGGTPPTIAPSATSGNYYKVRAYNTGGYGPFSAMDCGTPLLGLPESLFPCA